MILPITCYVFIIKMKPRFFNNKDETVFDFIPINIFENLKKNHEMLNDPSASFLHYSHSQYLQKEIQSNKF